MTDTGRHPRMGFEPRQPRSHVESVEDFKDRMESGLREAQAALTKAKDEYAHYYNRRRTPGPDFKPGDRVWLDASDIKTTRPSAKLAHRRLGPYTVERQVGKGAYKLKLPPSLRQLHNVFPVVKLTPALPDPIPGRRPPPPPTPILVEGIEEHVVEDILNSRLRYGRVEYLVKWKGFGVEENSWEPHYNVHSPDRVRRFHRLNPAAPRHISAIAFDSLRFRPRFPADIATSWRSTHRGVAPLKGG